MSFPEKSFKEAVTQGRLLARPTQPTETTLLARTATLATFWGTRRSSLHTRRLSGG